METAPSSSAFRLSPIMLLLIDNYDSFTYNLVHYLGEVIQGSRRKSTQIEVRRNDAVSVDEALDLKPQAIVLSPGPCDPDRAGVCLDLIKAAAPDVPMFGVCLGHQAMGQAFGGDVVRAHAIMHGKTSPIRHGGSGVFAKLPDPLTATRYHSLTVDRETFPDALEITAETEDGVIMGLRHRAHPIHGVQFHPESIRSEHGREMLKNFLRLAEVV